MPLDAFPARPKPYPGESLRGYLRRQAAAMDCDTVKQLDEVLPPEAPRLHLAKDTTLARVLGLPEGIIKRMRYQKVSEQVYKFRDVQLPMYFLHLTKVRVCPLCIKEAAYHRQVWDLAFVRVCPVHSIELVDRCAACSSELSWEHRGVRECTHCGEAIRPLKMATYPEEAALLNRILSWIGGVDDDQVPVGCSQALVGLPFFAVIEFCNALGRVRALQSGMKLGKGRSFSDANVALVLEYGIEVADRWPRSFKELMDVHVGKLSKRGSLTSQVGLMARLAVRGPGEWRHLIHSALADFLVEHPEVPCRPNHDLGKEVLGRRGFCTIKEAQEMLAVDQRRFASIRKSAAWKRIVDMADVSGFLPMNAVRELAADIRGIMSLIELGAAIGITDKVQLKRISDSGVFASAGDADHYDHRTKHFLRSDVEALLALIADVPQKTTPDFRLVKFKTVLALGAQRGQGICEVIKFFRQGSLLAISRSSGSGLSGLQFIKEEAIGLFDRAAAEELGSITLREAASRLSVLEREAYQLAKLGVLRTEHVEGRGNQRGQRVTMESIEAFNRTYVSSAKWATEQNVSHSIAKERLAKGLEPSLSKRLAQRLNVYRRLSCG